MPQPLDFLGASIAGIHTCVEVPSLKLALDLGACSSTAVHLSTVLVSHGHLDHCGALPVHAARRSLLNLPPARYVVPRAIAADVEELFNAAGRLDGKAIPRHVVPLAPGEELELGKRRTIRPFATFHRVVSQGYAVLETRHRLREPFAGMDGRALGELRARGEKIEDEHRATLLAFTGDTRVEVLEASEEVRTAESLVMELSFLDARVSVEQSREMGHVHLDEVTARRDLLPRGDILFMHFSARYGPADIKRLVAPLRDACAGTIRTLI